MTGYRRKLATRLIELAGYSLTPVGNGGPLLLQRQGATPRLTVDQLDRETYLLQPKGPRRRTLRQIGPRAQRTHLLVDEDETRSRMNRLQRTLGRYLAHEQIAWTLRALEVNVVLDVGANRGQFGLSLRQQGYAGRIVSFEPLPEHAARLRAHAAADPDWVVYDFALGDSEGEAEINVVPGTMSSLLPASDFGRGWSDKLRVSLRETIRIRRLESVWDDAVSGVDTPRVYLKLDTQGFDVPAFRGAGARIGEVVGMQSEVSCVPIYDGMPRLPEQLTMYESEGFEIAGMFAVSRDPKTVRVIEFDVVMVRPDQVDRRLTR
jgi:FkbM family methyltransferase